MTIQEFGLLSKDLADLKSSYVSLSQQFDTWKSNLRTIRTTYDPVPIRIGYFAGGNANVSPEAPMVVVRGADLVNMLRDHITWLENILKTAIENKDITL